VQSEKAVIAPPASAQSMSGLRAQAMQWMPSQVVVFLQNMNLSHLRERFLRHSVTGSRLIDFTERDIRDVRSS
jgi:hypothetical protein